MTAATPPRFEIGFDGDADETTVTIVHSGLERLGPVGSAMRDRNRHGWAGLLPHFRQAVADRPG